MESVSSVIQTILNQRTNSDKILTPKFNKIKTKKKTVNWVLDWI